ncbi:MAG: hypothetical protein A2X34_03135 [Elusimicrobia bacterium GWC2_51_8]|nr:MAG: hypothetical protein A2X33_09595 [Elusimicrobia bacterium GWA2_51_34]OGR58885.1 MAG: hypothetical protein A2X34_03135 [Elusimicrobia bacterium GWC2_51_8]OGR85384.1 MAG: hypothetical protein A2021_09050 [Elusimicrobia bacterium GWF2_52_66]HAF95034.1 hypothetical protein [Elusimicrobiota bacterium]HCE97949.1 hypothetical protein [Elusimicrobiota bacterium]
MAISQERHKASVAFFCFPLLSFAFFCLLWAAPVLAIDYNDKNAQSFDYTPADNQTTPSIAQPTITSEYEDADIIDDPVYGVVALSKQRWKNWVLRAVYLLLIDIALVMLIIALPKTDEYTIITSYILSGASFVLALWEFLCAVFLFQLGSTSWLYVAPVSFIMGAVFYLMLLKIKKFDTSLEDLKKSFQQMNAVNKEDARLVSVDGTPGNWPDQDFIR